MTPNSPESRSLTILLVDDRPENLIALQDILEQEGRTFLTATSGNEALKIVLRNQDIGLIMLDVQMPDMDGFEVARLLKANPKTRDISIIFVTAINKEEQYVLKGFEEGAVDYLQKPLDINVTRAKVHVFEHLYFYQRQLKQSLGNLETVNRQLERFVYTVSHDLKSPLSGIATLISTIVYEADSIEPEELSLRLDLIGKASMHLIHMVDSILEYSRQSYDEQKLSDVDVNELVRDTFQLLFAPPSVQLRIMRTLPRLRTRKLKLQQVFQNLISNAVKYIDKPEGLIEVDCEETDQYYVFSVKDNGPGLKDNDAQLLFGLFRTGGQASSRDSSTGVGLNLLKVIVEEQGGRIWAESEAGVGSTFLFEWKK